MKHPSVVLVNNNKLVSIWNSLLKISNRLKEKHVWKKKRQTHKIFPIASRFKIFKCKAAGPTNTKPLYCMKHWRKTLLRLSVSTSQLHNWKCATMVQLCFQNPAECVYLEPSGSVMAHSLQDKVLRYLMTMSMSTINQTRTPISMWENKLAQKILRSDSLKDHFSSSVCWPTDTNMNYSRRSHLRECL